MRSLTNPADMLPIPGIQVPREFYWVLPGPAPLAGMRRPSDSTPWAAIAAAGFHHVICLMDHEPEYDPSPLAVAHAVELEDLFHKPLPQDPAREEILIHQAVQTILVQLERDQGVVVHCWGGTGRTGTVIGGVLRVLGHPVPAILEYLDRLNKARGNAGWPESDWQAEFVTRYRGERQ